jgi:ferredoxin--NADP+ reductase
MEGVVDSYDHYIVAVIGAGPAGLFAARQLATDGINVVIINRDLKPGGLAEYGIFPEKIKMKEGLRKQFHQIIAIPQIEYFGNIKIGESGDLSLENLQRFGFQAILVTAGAQGTKWLGLPGEELPRGVYHAKDLVYHYNKLPPYSEKLYAIGKRVALVGVGNVMMDIARWLARTVKVDEIIAVARRGPAEVKFDKKEMEYLISNLDQEALQAEIDRVAPVMVAIGQDPQAAKDYILAALPKGIEPVSQTTFRFDFLASPTRIIGDNQDNVCGLEIANTTLLPTSGDTKAKTLWTKRVVNVDTVIFCIGDRVDEQFGLPVQWNEYVKNPNPQYPVDGISYESYDPETGLPIKGVFVAGWSREASSGLVGIARKDGERGAKAILQYLQTMERAKNPGDILENFRNRLARLAKPIVTKEHLPALDAAELEEAAKLGVEDFKFGTNEEMLKVMKLR